MANRTVSVDLVANVGQYQSAMVRAASTTKSVGDSAATSGTKAQRGFEAAGRGASLLGAALAGGVAIGLKRTVDLAANAEQSVGGVEAVFKNYAKSVIADSQAADRALGLSANSYRELATVIGSQLKNAGVPMEELATQTDSLITMGADLAAMFGGTTEEAVRALSSALKGEMDPIEAYGISLSDAALKAEAAALGLEVLGGTLSTQQRTMAVMSLVTKQGADAVGAFGRESDTAAGRAARASAQWENLQTAIGEKLLPVWSSLMDFIGTTVIPGLETVGGAIADVGGFMADNEGLALALAAALGIRLAGGLTAVTVAFNRLILTNVVLGLSNVLGAVLDLPTALRTASGAVAGFVAAAAPLAAVGGVIYAFTEFASTSAEIEERLKAAAEAGDDFGRVLSAQGGVINSTTRDAAALAVEAAGLAEAFEDISATRIAQGLAGNADALDELREAAEQLDAEASFLGNSWGLLGVSMDVVSGRASANADALWSLVDATKAVGVGADVANGYLPLFGQTFQTIGEQATGAATATQAAATVSQEAIDEWRDHLQQSVQGFVDPLATYQGMVQSAAQATADATSDASDSWSDYVDDVDVSLGDLADLLQKQIENQANWRTNIGQIAQWAGADVAQYLADMGEEGVDLVAQMADGTNGEAQRMAGLIRQTIQNGGDDWTAAMDTEMRALALIGRDGSARTVQEVARQLGVGVSVVRDIARRYGIELASGVNPLLRGLGKPGINISDYSYNSGGGRADGGFIDGFSPHPRADNILTPMTAGEHVQPVKRVKQYGGDLFEAFRAGAIDVRAARSLLHPGRADGGFISASSVPRPPSTAPYRSPISPPGDETMNRAYGDTVDWVNANSAPPIASGSPGQWQAMFAAVQRQFPGVVLHSGFRPGSITATGNLSYHASGRAIDITPSMDIFNWLASNYRNSRELIFSPAGIRQIWNGQPHYYSEPTRGDHWDHIHWAMRNGGVIGEPVIGRGMWSGGSYSFAENGPETVQPGVRSREFGGSVAYSAGSSPVVVSIEGARLVGTLMVNGLEAQMDARVVSAVSNVNSQLAAAGVR